MLHSFFDRTLYIHHVERFRVCKKEEEKNINVRAPKSMRRKKKKKEK